MSTLTNKCNLLFFLAAKNPRKYCSMKPTLKKKHLQKGGTGVLVA
jgi:hypothetical protein